MHTGSVRFSFALGKLRNIIISKKEFTDLFILLILPKCPGGFATL